MKSNNKLTVKIMSPGRKCVFFRLSSAHESGSRSVGGAVGLIDMGNRICSLENFAIALNKDNDIGLG